MEKGRFGIHGGQYIPETLMNEIIHLEEQYEFYKNDPEFCAEIDDLLKNYAGRPSLVRLLPSSSGSWYAPGSTGPVAQPPSGDSG